MSGRDVRSPASRKRRAERPVVAIAVDRLDRRRHTFGLLLEHLVRSLRTEAMDLDIVLVRDRQRTDILVDGVREIFVPAALSRTSAYARLVPLWLARHGVSLVHFPFLFAPATWAGTSLRRVVTIHGASRAALDDDLVSKFSEAELARTRRRLGAFDRVLTVSESAKREVVEHYRVPQDRVTVVYNGVGDSFRPGASSDLALAKYGLRRPYILTISTIKPKKNVLESVRAFARLRERHPDMPHQLALVGYTMPGYTEVADEIRALGLSDHVVTTGWTESADIPALYAGADLVLFPSLHEGFGLPVVEGMASGVPVVASNVCSIPEVGGDAILTFDPSNLDDIVATAERALFDPSTRAVLVERGLERAARFTWTEAARKTAAVYRELLAR
ncbi:MAG: glycosyltransferase family 4 protein [Blastocatellia bacterium]|nr:glycosyltransferase family 4 protein [Blastocatellia bacterium]